MWLSTLQTWLLSLDSTVFAGVIIGALLLLAAFAFWFTEPVRHSFSDQPALTYTHSYRDAGGEQPFPSVYEPATVDLSLIIPAYNEEKRLDVMMKETLDYLSARSKRNPSFKYELIIVNDGSKDRTVERAQLYVNTLSSDVVRVLDLKKNQGKGGAVQQGMLHARGKLLLMVDADGATRIEDLEKLEEAVADQQRDGFGIAVGSRAHLAERAVAKRKWYRNVLMYGFHFLVSFLAGIRNVQDTQCGFKLFTRKAARMVFGNQHLRRWCFDVELLSIAQQLSIPIAEVGVNWEEIPGSKLDLLESSVLMGRDLVMIRLAFLCCLWKVERDVDKLSAMHRKSA